MSAVAKPVFLYAARLDRVVDGDTYAMEIDLGFRVWMKVPVRVYQLYCPELHGADGVTVNPAGAAAQAAAVNLFAQAKAITVRSRKAESYQRVLADVFLDGVSMADTMAANGYGVKK